MSEIFPTLRGYVYTVAGKTCLAKTGEIECRDSFLSSASSRIREVEGKKDININDTYFEVLVYRSKLVREDLLKFAIDTSFYSNGMGREESVKISYEEDASGGFLYKITLKKILQFSSAKFSNLLFYINRNPVFDSFTYPYTYTSKKDFRPNYSYEDVKENEKRRQQNLLYAQNLIQQVLSYPKKSQFFPNNTGYAEKLIIGQMYYIYSIFSIDSPTESSFDYTSTSYTGGIVSYVKEHVIPPTLDNFVEFLLKYNISRACLDYMVPIGSQKSFDSYYYLRIKEETAKRKKEQKAAEVKNE